MIIRIRRRDGVVQRYRVRRSIENFAKRAIKLKEMKEDLFEELKAVKTDSIVTGDKLVEVTKKRYFRDEELDKDIEKLDHMNFKLHTETNRMLSLVEDLKAEGKSIATEKDLANHERTALKAMYADLVTTLQQENARTKALVEKQQDNINQAFKRKWDGRNAKQDDSED